jgi:hypothetical protein
MLLDLIIGAAVAIMIMSVLIQASTQIAIGHRVHREGYKLAVSSTALQNYLNAKGELIINTGSASGFANAYSPQLEELQAAGYMPTFITARTPFGGTLTFIVRRGVQNDLMALACDNQNVTYGSQASEYIAAKVVSAAGGNGLKTNSSSPTILNGPSFTGIVSPISGDAIVCTWAFLPRPS